LLKFQHIISKNNVKEEQKHIVESGRVFYVPLVWFIENRAIYMQRQDGDFH
jgi:hypothetical protein